VRDLPCLGLNDQEARAVQSYVQRALAPRERCASGTKGQLIQGGTQPEAAHGSRGLRIVRVDGVVDAVQEKLGKRANGGDLPSKPMGLDVGQIVGDNVRLKALDEHSGGGSVHSAQHRLSPCSTKVGASASDAPGPGRESARARLLYGSVERQRF